MLKTAVGTCAYCGQACTVEVEEGYSQEQVDKIVTSKCLCEQAKEMRVIKMRTEKGIESINQLFGDTDTGMILKAAAQQAPAAISVIKFTYLYVPIIVWVVMMLIAMCYKLDKTYKQMMAELSVRELSGKL